MVLRVIYIMIIFNRYLPFIISKASLTTLISFFIFNSAVWLLSIAYTEIYGYCLHCVVFIVALCFLWRDMCKRFLIFLSFGSEFPSSFNYILTAQFVNFFFVSNSPLYRKVQNVGYCKQVYILCFLKNVISGQQIDNKHLKVGIQYSQEPA